MTPTLRGRLETRIFLAIVVGATWTAIASPWLPRPPQIHDLAGMYRETFQSLALMAGIGLAWEVVYHCLQQLRWDKDWPSLFGLMTLLNEGTLLWFVTFWTHVRPGSEFALACVPLAVSYMVSTWVLMWLFLQGPLRVIHLRWRFEGGRVLPRRLMLEVAVSAERS